MHQSSRIDYGNMALVSLPKVATKNILSIFNTTARLITGVRKDTHFTLVLKKFHWLKIDESLNLKLIGKSKTVFAMRVADT